MIATWNVLHLHYLLDNVRKLYMVPIFSCYPSGTIRYFQRAVTKGLKTKAIFLKRMISNSLSMIWKFVSWMKQNHFSSIFFHKLITWLHFYPAGKTRASSFICFFEKTRLSCYKLSEEKSIKLQMLALKKYNYRVC